MPLADRLAGSRGPRRQVLAEASAERHRRIWDVVAGIPRGRVATYGDVARAAGLVRGARQVGTALRQCPPQLGLPWHRVLAAGGRIALAGSSAIEQRLRLEQEDVPFSGSRVRMDLCGWEFPEP